MFFDCVYDVVAEFKEFEVLFLGPVNYRYISLHTENVLYGVQTPFIKPYI